MRTAALSSLLILPGLFLFAAIACSSRAGASAGKGEWKNPTISCRLKEREDPIQQFPVSQPASAEKLADFCNRMKDRFSQSKLTEVEATTVYGMLHRAGILKDASYGMPGPGVPPAKPLTVQDYRQRIAIRKTSENEYELFYTYTNCGTNYEHSRIAITNNTAGQPERIEAWSGLFPC